MDLSCIISSGDLELYVLGMLPEEEAYKIKQLAILFPEVKQELDRISETLEDFANTTASAPSASVKDKLMGKLKDLKTQETNHTNPLSVAYPTDDSEIKKETPVIPIQQSEKRTSYLAAASFIGLIICIGFIIYLVSQNKDYQNRVAVLNNHIDTLKYSSQLQQRQLTETAQLLSMMQDENYRKINMTNVPGKPQALAQVFWNKQTHEVYVADVSLPTPPSDKQYQLWAIVDGKPVDAGLLNNGKQQMQKMKTFDKADAFAITLENKGGSPTPTMQAMYVMAKVS